jgi:hypothetical protein
MSTQNPDNTPGDKRLKKLVAADAVFESLLGRGKGSVVLQSVKSHAGDIQRLLAQGLSAKRISELLADPLDARPSTVLAALHETGLVQKRPKKNGGHVAADPDVESPSASTRKPHPPDGHVAPALATNVTDPRPSARGKFIGENT